MSDEVNCPECGGLVPRVGLPTHLHLELSYFPLVCLLCKFRFCQDNDAASHFARAHPGLDLAIAECPDTRKADRIRFLLASLPTSPTPFLNHASDDDCDSLASHQEPPSPTHFASHRVLSSQNWADGSCHEDALQTTDTKLSHGGARQITSPCPIDDDMEESQRDPVEGQTTTRVSEESLQPGNANAELKPAAKVSEVAGPSSEPGGIRKGKTGRFFRPAEDGRYKLAGATAMVWHCRRCSASFPDSAAVRSHILISHCISQPRYVLDFHKRRPPSKVVVSQVRKGRGSRRVPLPRRQSSGQSASHAMQALPLGHEEVASCD